MATQGQLTHPAQPSGIRPGPLSNQLPGYTETFSAGRRFGAVWRLGTRAQQHSPRARE